MTEQLSYHMLLCRPEDAGVLYYSIRRVADVVQPLAGASIEQDVPTAAKVHAGRPP